MIRNNSQKKDYIMKPVQSQAQPFISPRNAEGKPLDKTKIIDATPGSSQVSLMQGESPKQNESKPALMRIQSSRAGSQGSQASKRVLNSYDNRRPFH